MHAAYRPRPGRPYMSRIDRVKVRVRRHLPGRDDEDSLCPLCLHEEDTFDHFLVSCEHEICLKLRRKAITVLTTHMPKEVRKCLVDFDNICDALKSPHRLRDHEAKLVTDMFKGFVRINPCDGFPSNQEDRTMCAKQVLKLIHLSYKTWLSRCKLLHTH